jgi:hypothetical protein
MSHFSPTTPRVLLAAAILAMALIVPIRAAGPGTAPAATQPSTRPAHDDPPATTRPAHDVYSIDQVLEVLDQANPQLAQRLRTALKDNPQRVKDMIDRVAKGRLKSILDRKHNDPQMYQLLLQEYRITILMEQQAAAGRAATDTAVREQARAHLMDLLHQDMAVHQKMSQLVITRMTERLAELQKQFDTRAKDEDKIVADRLDHMLPAQPDKQPPKK